MKNAFIKRIIVALSVVACSLCLVATPDTTLPIQAAAGEEALQPNAEILEWVYAIIDGKYYKRLYNCTRQQWAGDWIYVSDVE